MPLTKNARRRLMWTLLAAATLVGCSRLDPEQRALKRARAFEQKSQFQRAEIEYLNARKQNERGRDAIVGLGLMYMKEGAVVRAIPYLRMARELAPDNVSVRLGHALLASAMGNKKSAREDALFVLQHNPSDPDAPLVLIDASVTREESAEAKSILNALPGKAASSAPVLTALAVQELRDGNALSGEALLNQALSANPNFDAALTTASVYWETRGNREKADELAEKASAAAAPYSPRATFYAQVMIRRGKLDQAEKALNETIKRMPAYLPPKSILAELYASQRKTDEATKTITAVLDRDPQNPDATLLRSRLYQAAGKMDKAAADLEKLLVVFPTHARALYQLATVQIATGDVGKAIGSLGKASAADPNLIESQTLLAEIYLRQNDSSSALLILDEIAKHNPRNVRARLLRAEAYRLQARFVDARQVYLDMEKDYAKDPQFPLVRGMMEIQGKNYDQARYAFERSASLSNNALPALEQLVTLDLGLNRPADAISRIRSVISGGREEAALYILLGRAQVANANAGDAEASFRRAIALAPENKNGYFFLARLYIDSRQTDKALDNLKLVTEKNPKDTSALLLTGILLEERKDFEAAKVAYEKALVADPKFGPALNNLAYLYAERFNRVDDAHELASRARDLTPNDPYAADTLGWILYRQGKFNWAISLIREAAEKLPSSGEVQYHLGMVQYRLGDEKSAVVSLENALRLDAEFNGRDEAKARLEKLGRKESTASELNKALESSPDDPVLIARLAALSVKEGNPDKAISLYTHFLKGAPESVVGLKGLALAYQAKGDWEKAAEAARNARKFVKEDGEMAAVLGRAAWASGDRKFAYTMLQDAARRVANDATIQADLAESAFSQGRLDESETALAAAQKMQPGIRSGWAPAGSEKLKPLWLKAHANPSDPASRQALEAILDTYPDYSPAIRDLAISLADSKADPERAYRLATRARESDRTDREVARVLGTLAFQRGEFSRAASLLGEVTLASRDAKLHLLLAKAQAQVKGADPRPAANQAIELGLSGADLEEAKVLLKK